MFIRSFVYADSKIEAESVFEDIVTYIKSNIKSRKYIKNEPYWKCDKMFVVEVEIGLNKYLNEVEINEFLKSISNKWLTFGNPINEIVVSDATEDCILEKNNVSMINIFI
ncbi:hypothetical protein [Clostridium oceanicum]|uniref:Uncharacterized protein n=1 Tax=Clostridium oceanicum TaxID=1543 RepID=A0ABP3USQ1_9CLOT